MKNKKLFAILTLVCFMFTLMPVAAFAADVYAEVDSDYAIVKLPTTGGVDVKVKLTNEEQNGSYFIYAVDKDGALYTKLTGETACDVNSPDGIRYFAAKDVATVTFNNAGEYKVYVTPVSQAMANVVGNANYERTNAQILALLMQEKVTMLDNAVTVKPAATSYALSFVSANAAGNDVDVKANAGYAMEEIEVKLTNFNEPVVGAELKLHTNSYAVDLSADKVTTNAAGIAKFKVAANTAGEFKVYVEYGTKADATLTVNAGTLTPAKITTVGQPTAPVALDQQVIKSNIAFIIADANGNAVKNGMVQKTTEVEGNYKVTVVEKPAASTMDGDDITLYYDAANGVWLLNNASFDEEGEYTFKVTLNNGNYAVAKATVKEFQTPVALKMSYKQNAVELDGTAVLDKLFYVDANGTEKSLIKSVNSNVYNSATAEAGDFVKVNDVADVKLAANGYAVENFYATAFKGVDNDAPVADVAPVAAGTIIVKADEKYVGSKITVVAVDTKYNLTATADLVVANEASSVKYANTEVEVGVNNTLVANIVDADGNKVALNGSINNANISYVVVGTPSENAKVAVTTVSEELATKGQFKVSFTASEIGEYELQTVVTYEQADGVIKYYSGVETITVGNAGIEDVVVMSVNSNEIVKNGEVAVIDAAPIVENNRTFVPFRALAEAFGATVAFDEATQAVTAELNGTTVVMTIGSAEYTVNGVAKTADVAPFINGSRTMVPVRFVAEAFGITVTPTYDENGATADILFAK